MEFNPNDVPSKTIYKVMTGSIVPRPIGWISTVDAAGRPNLAPFSYFNALGSNPPHLMFAPGTRSTDKNPKDTLKNVRATGEFVANIVTRQLAEAMNITATELPPEVNEFELAGLTASPSVTVQAPRVAESPIHFECKVTHIIDLGEVDRGSSVVIGEIVHFHVSDEVLFDGDKIDPVKLDPVGRLAGWMYCRTTDLFEMPRPRSQLKN
ncbi:MAG: flavin reductase family protein [Anaerolineales bacterium]|nr:flavin reductase family protein [Anaerolineales bacterium]